VLPALVLYFHVAPLSMPLTFITPLLVTLSVALVPVSEAKAILEVDGAAVSTVIAAAFVPRPVVCTLPAASVWRILTTPIA